MQPAEELYQRLKEEASSLDEAEFVRRHDGWYFYSEMPVSEQDRIPFVTQVHALDSLSAEPAPEETSDTPDRVWKVEKNSNNAWKRRISLGRAPNNDIVIRHDSVSKLHAHFHFPTIIGASRDQSPPYLLTDVGSANGTTINGSLVAVDVPTPVGNKDRLVFGTISGRLLDASTLHSELNALDWF